MPQTRLNVRKMVLASIFAAIMALSAWISLPVLEIAFTLQTLAVLTALGLLGGKWGTVSIGIYLLLGAVGMPVFSGFRGGPGVLLGVTGGYILGFLATGLTYWLVTGLLGEHKSIRLAAMLLGLLACYSFGSWWFLTLYLQKGTELALSAVIASCVLPYLVPDLLKLALAYGLTCRIKPYLRF